MRSSQAVPPRARSSRSRIGRALGALALAAGGLAVAAALVVAGRIALYRQTDDRQHLDSKRRYLERVAGLAPRAAGPSVVVILFDDLGYGDLGVYGSDSIRTPNVDRLAAEGVRFTNAYSASPYCSASRAALLTGRYAARAGLDLVVQAPGTSRDRLLKLGWRNRRLPAEEITLAEVLQSAGWATAAFGKWHLGNRSPSLPNDLGFGRYYGLLNSNDQGEPAVWQDREIVERHPIDQTTLTRRYTERAVAFLEENRGRPFFLYLPHTFPHVPLHVAADRLGTSAGGLYGDAVEELDDSVGTVVATLERLGVADDTLIVLTSDNGPWFQGSPGVTRGRKLEIFEGGMRVPMIVRWPRRVAGGAVVDDPVVGIDVFPTVLELAGLPLPDDRVVDGESLAEVLTAGAPGPHDAVYYHQLGVVRAVRSGRFKYHDRHRVGFGNPMDWPVEFTVDRGPWLFDLALDPRESYDVSARHPEEARRLRGLLEERRREMETHPRGWL
jgi:arylsulfatase A-like enzyme